MAFRFGGGLFLAFRRPMAVTFLCFTCQTFRCDTLISRNSNFVESSSELVIFFFREIIMYQHVSCFRANKSTENG